jgi:lactate dehydrogenase-like 2-hydroxyacid dehydrogenase
MRCIKLGHVEGASIPFNIESHHDPSVNLLIFATGLLYKLVYFEKERSFAMKVFVFDPLWSGLITPENIQKINSSGCNVLNISQGSSLEECPELFSSDEEKVLAINPDYVGWKLSADQFKNIKNLKCIITQSTSYGWVDTSFAASQGIAVCNIRNFSTDAVADWATMMMLNLARKVPLLLKNDFPLNFGTDFETYRGINLKEKTAGIIGLGNIGSAIAERCEGLGMKVLYWNRTPKASNFKEVDIKEIFENSDVVFPCMADNKDTHGIIIDDMIHSLKPTAMLVSIVHKYYNHDLVLDMVRKNKLFGYGFEADPQSFGNCQGNVWAAPAYAWCTDGSMRKAMDLFVDAIVFASQDKYPNRVN